MPPSILRMSLSDRSGCLGVGKSSASGGFPAMYGRRIAASCGHKGTTRTAFSVFVPRIVCPLDDLLGIRQRGLYVRPRPTAVRTASEDSGNNGDELVIR